MNEVNCHIYIIAMALVKAKADKHNGQYFDTMWFQLDALATKSQNTKYSILE